MGLNHKNQQIINKISKIVIFYLFLCDFVYTVSVLGRDQGYTVKYNPLPEGVSEGTPEAKGLYLTVYPELSPNTDIISF